ncbi:fibrinogen-like YCDxxxxGGGW domain-containing protein [Nannocystis radixulma]|uniref:Fibrinogen-like YCDxxxxGGGW domain-containing protein n=1 Tax=Nannocystis radixulma TaxID=2995305 RepID=A0ABT5B7Y4_9BACT|nr:fibrinogen-like YCDxxxxGGGW domain-containing protein [Nannocystis radixulma]MDC0669202.1 fibrinogen-like YCDxxxxGGGW domain-containing protein [Nannocystis radixulma]
MPRLRFLLLALCLAPACSETAVQGSTTDTTDTEATTSGASEAGSEGPPTSTAGASCGDGVVDPGEACDDGNAADDDECTSACTLPSCDDGLKDGDEGDVDCGGACASCPDDSTCKDADDCASGVCVGTCVGLYASCLELHGWHPNLPDGEYDLDPDGDGVPVKLRCDMVGGGWTEVALDTMDAPSGWSAGTPSSCGALSEHLLGGAGQFGAGAATEKTFALLGVPHMAVRVIADVVIIDSWEGETLRVEIDGQPVASGVCSQGIAGSCGTVDHQCGDPQYKEGKLELNGMIDLPGDSATIRLSSTLDQGPEDEAWGIDTVSVRVK